MLFVHFFYKKSLHSSNIYDILHIEHTFYKGKGVDKNEHTNYNVEEQKCMSENEDKKAKRHQEDLERLRGFRPIDDTFMRGLFKENIPLAELVLQIITGLSLIHI